MYPDISLFNLIHIPTYFLVVSIATTIGCAWFLKLARRQDLSFLMSIDLALVVLISGLLGARLLHVAFEEPAYYKAQPLQILALWNGGFVFFGGFIGALLAGALYCQIRREPFWVWADLVARPAALAYAIGRLGCFLNGCCYGTHCDLPWSVYMQGDFRHPTQLYAALWELMVVLGLSLVTAIPGKRLHKPGAMFNIWLVAHAFGRLLMETFRADPRGDLILGMSISTWISAALISWAGFNLIFIFKPRGD